jgi:hypothetical protein
MKWLNVILISLLVYSCAANNMYNVNSRKFRKEISKNNISDDKIEGITRNLSVQGNTNFNLPTYPADTMGYGISPLFYDSTDSYVLNGEKVIRESSYNLTVDSCITSPFGNVNTYVHNDLTLSNFYLPNRLTVTSQTDFVISVGDTFSWVPESKNKYLLFYTLEEDQTYTQYLIKDDGQFIVPKSLIQSMKKDDYVRSSFSRSYDRILLASDGIPVRLSSYTGSSGNFRIKKATQ